MSAYIVNINLQRKVRSIAEAASITAALENALQGFTIDTVNIYISTPNDFVGTPLASCTPTAPVGQSIEGSGTGDDEGPVAATAAPAPSVAPSEEISDADIRGWTAKARTLGRVDAIRALIMSFGVDNATAIAQAHRAQFIQRAKELCA